MAAGDVSGEAAQPVALSESTVVDAVKEEPASTREVADDEVSAALASIAPTNGHGESAAMGADTDKWSREQVPVTMAVAGAAEEYSGPRWIAESVAVMGDEATLVLEQEMEKAYAAFAAADAARMGFGSSFIESSSSSVVDAPAPNSESLSPPAESFVNSDNSASEPQEPIPAASTGREESAEHSIVAASSSADAVSESTVPEVQESAAYAAAASAGPGAADMTMGAETTSQPSPVTESSDHVPPAAEISGQQGESELAAAWANWKQIRESVIGSQLSSQIAETVAELKEAGSESQSESQPVASSATEEDASDISNIVDSVLADLKPKLMAEIAKKMGKEKKK